MAFPPEEEGNRTNDRNYWEQIESYISNHSNALFSHGICPDCGAMVKAEVESIRNKSPVK